MLTIAEQVRGGRPGARIIDLANGPDIADGDGDRHRQAAEVKLAEAYSQPHDPVQVAIAEALLAIGCELRGLRDGEVSAARSAAEWRAQEAGRPERAEYLRMLSR